MLNRILLNIFTLTPVSSESSELSINSRETFFRLDMLDLRVNCILKI